MFAFVRVAVFVACLAVKFVETEFVFRKMRRDPVQNDADTRLVGLFNFAGEPKTPKGLPGGRYRDLLTGREVDMESISLPAYGFFWLKQL